MFEPRFGVDEGPGYPLLDAYIESGGDTSHVWLVGGKMGSADEVKEAEASATAGVISRAITEQWHARDSKDGKLALSDIAVLYRSRSVLPSLTAALTAVGIPFRIEGDTDVLDTDEVRAVVSVLRVAVSLDDPDRGRIHRVAAMASLAGGRLAPELSGDDVPRARDWDSLLGELPSLPPSQAVRLVIEAFELDALAGGGTRPRAALNRLRCLMDRAMAVEAEGIVTLPGFVGLLDGELHPDLNESPAPERDEASARLMTVHGAKGLEFPMVVLGFSGKGRNAPAILPTRDGAVSIKLGSKESAYAAPGGREMVETAEKEAEEGEADRLLYVGITRARDHLVVSAFHHSRSAPVLKALIGTELDAHRVEVGRAAKLIQPTMAFNPPDTTELRAKWKALDKRENRTTPTREAAAEHTLEAAGEDTFEQDDRDEEEFAEAAFVAWLVAKSSTAFGRAVHWLCRTSTCMTRTWSRRLARRQAYTAAIVLR